MASFFNVSEMNNNLYQFVLIIDCTCLYNLKSAIKFFIQSLPNKSRIGIIHNHDQWLTFNGKRMIEVTNKNRKDVYEKVCQIKAKDLDQSDMLNALIKANWIDDVQGYQNRIIVCSDSNDFKKRKETIEYVSKMCEHNSVTQVHSLAIES